jgi:hypothetical protein
MIIERGPMRKKERYHCVSEIRTKENTEKSIEEERKGSVCKWDMDQREYCR